MVSRPGFTDEDGPRTSPVRTARTSANETHLACSLPVYPSFTLLARSRFRPAAQLLDLGQRQRHNLPHNLTAFLHQHGPLFNYGPYYGYPPFEPYGPWNAYLQYNPWYYGYGQGGCSKCPDRDLSGHGGLGWSPSWHSSWLHGGWFHGCSTCGCGGVFPSHLFHHDSLPCPCETIAPGDAKAVSSRPVTNLEIVDPVTRCGCWSSSGIRRFLS